MRLVDDGTNDALDTMDEVQVAFSKRELGHILAWAEQGLPEIAKLNQAHGRYNPQQAEAVAKHMEAHADLKTALELLHDAMEGFGDDELKVGEGL